MIKVKGIPIEVIVTYKMAMFDFKAYGLNMLKLFQDDNALMSVMVDDEMLINIMHYYCKEHVSTVEDLVDELDKNPDLMQEFRDQFWDAVLNFTNPLMREALRQTRKLIEEQLASPEKNLRQHLSVSSDGQDATQPSSPSVTSSS